MGRTAPSFRNAIEMEKREWKPFLNALDKSERNEFDKMWDIPRLYVSAFPANEGGILLLSSEVIVES